MRHDWTRNYGGCVCAHCGADGNALAYPGCEVCPGKPAGNTGRHETPSETGLWDRLRADLNNLGAAYGPLETPQSPLTPFGEALQSLSSGLAEGVTSQPERFERAAWDLPITFTARLGGRTP